MTSSHDGISRRSVLKGASAAAAAATFGFPAIVRAQSATSIKLGIPTILSGRVAQLGISSTNAVKMAVDEFNAAGGLDGRMIELLIRDTKAKPEEAARVVRDFINSEGVDVVFNCEASSASFAVQEVVREAGTFCTHCCSETSSLSADPAIRSENSFRFARQGIHDAVASATYAAEMGKKKGIKKWMAVSPDYAYGRDSVEQFFNVLQQVDPEAEIVGYGWPKLFEPDYTQIITQVLQKQPDAVYSALWGGDLVSFIDQGALYGLFSGIEFFGINLADYTTMSAVRELPEGLHSGTRYIAAFPDTEANHAFDAAYHERWGDHPTNWAWQSAAGIDFLIAAIKETGSTDSGALAEAMRGMKRPSPFGADGTLTMRAEDQTVVNYALGWGTTVPKEPFLIDIASTDWSTVYEFETAWKKSQGYI